MGIPAPALGGKAPRGHKAANKMEICVPQAAPLNPFSEESLSRVKDNLKLRDASLAKAAAVRQKRTFRAGHNRLNWLHKGERGKQTGKFTAENRNF